MYQLNLKFLVWLKLISAACRIIKICKTRKYFCCESFPKLLWELRIMAVMAIEIFIVVLVLFSSLQLECSFHIFHFDHFVPVWYLISKVERNLIIHKYNIWTTAETNLICQILIILYLSWYCVTRFWLMV